MTTEADVPNPPIKWSAKDWWTLALCAAMLLLFACLSYSAVLTKCATFDEPLHAVSGYAIRNYSDYRIDPEDPAFFTWLSALPHGLNSLKFDIHDPFIVGDPTRTPPMKAVMESHDNQWVTTVKTLYRTPGNDADGYINRSRFLFMLIGVAAGAMVCWWGWQLAGRIGAFAATAAYSLDPNFLGHASLVKNDVPLALVTVGLMWAIWRCGRRATWWNLSAIVIALAAAMNVKFSGPVYFFIAFLALTARAIQNESWTLGPWQLKTRATRMLVPIAVCLAGGIFSFVTIWACYGFRFGPSTDPSVHFDFQAIVDRAKSGMITVSKSAEAASPVTPEEIHARPDPAMANLLRWTIAHKLLPEAWLHGFFYTYATTRMRGSFLNGNFSIVGWWYFFPLCVLFKAPTAMLLAALIAGITAIMLWVRRGFTLWDLLVAGSAFFALVRLVIWWLGEPLPDGLNVAWNVLMIAPLIARIVPILLRRTSRSESWAAVCLITPVAIYGGMAMGSDFNLGIRHLLPLLPFFHLALGIVISRMIWRWGNTGAVLAAGLGIALAIESCAAWPNYLAFFNAPAGGWRNGIFHLSDSNLDWGQDLPLLRDWQKQHPEKLLYLSYFGTADPNYYGIQHVDLVGGYLMADRFVMPKDPGILAVSATNLQGTYMGKDLRGYYSPLHKVEPREILGGTIYLYDFPLKPPTTQQ